MVAVRFARIPGRAVWSGIGALALASALMSPAIAEDKGGGGPQTATTTSAASLAPVVVDHHMHVHSPAILAFLPSYCSSVGRIGPCPEEFIRAYPPEELIEQMDKAGVSRGLIMSTAYLAESPMMQPPALDAARIVREANAWTVAVARKYPQRLGVYIGVNPVTATALPEIAHWANDPAVTGIKIHITNSGASFRDPVQVAHLRTVFDMARRSHLAIMIHMRTRDEDYGARDVETFIRDVLPAAGDTPVQIAHAAGWGGIDPQTLSALGAFASAIETHPGIAKNLTFDLAAVWKKDTPQPDLQALAGLIHRIGAEHFVPASDYPFSDDLTPYYAERYPALPLSEAEWRTIRSNRKDYDSAEFPSKRLDH